MPYFSALGRYSIYKKTGNANDKRERDQSNKGFYIDMSVISIEDMFKQRML